MPVDILLSIHEIRNSCVCRECDRTVIRDICLTLSTCLGGNQNDTIRSLHTINGSRCSILEDGNSRDIVRIDVVHRTRNTIHDYKRTGIIECRKTTDQHCVVSFTRSSCLLNIGHTGQTSCKHTLNISRRSLHQVFT